MSGDELENDVDRIVVEVAVDDLVLFASFEHSGNGQDRKRKAAIAWSGGAWVEEDDHELHSLEVKEHVIAKHTKTGRVWRCACRLCGSMLSNFG